MLDLNATDLRTCDPHTLRVAARLCTEAATRLKPPAPDAITRALTETAQAAHDSMATLLLHIAEIIDAGRR